MTPSPSSTSVAPAGELVGRLQDLVHKNSRRWKTVIVLEAIGLAVAVPLAYLWLVFYLDHRLHLPVLGRLPAGLGFLAGLGWAVVHLARRWRNVRLSEDQVALAIERRTSGEVANRLINAVQIARTAHAARPDLNEALVEENYEHLQQLHLEQAAQFRPAVLRLTLAGLLVALGLGFWLWQPEHFANAAGRILLPLADIDPLYRTILTVEPGDIEARGDIVIQITIKGERPKTLTLFKTTQGKRTAETIPVEAEDGRVLYTLRDVSQNLDYLVRGGDFTSPTYHIEVPRTASFSRLRVTYQYPAYTGLADKTAESTAGDLEALHGTRAKMTFVFDQPLDGAVLLLERPASSKTNGPAQPLAQVSSREFVGDIVLEDILGYRLEMVQGNRPRQRTPLFAVRILRDQEPKLELTGLERRAEVQVDSVLPLQATASDDYGLEKISLFTRRVADEPRAVAPALPDDGWQELVLWPGHKKTTFKQSHDLAMAALQVAEGDKLEIALRAVDTNPARQGAWTLGTIHELTVGGDGVGLQLQYKQILRAEGELKRLILLEQEWLQKNVSWVLKLDGGGELRWDDPKNVAALHAAVKELAGAQEKVRQNVSEAARTMPPQTGNLRVAVGLLADTEIVRLLRILDSVPSRDEPQKKGAALADARVTQERIVRSLEEILEQYSSFRADWELGHMVPFVKMLAERQTKMRDQSKRQVGQPAGNAERSLRLSMNRRQLKMQELCNLIQPAFVGLAARLKETEPALAEAYGTGAATLSEAGRGLPLQAHMRRAADHAAAGRWSETVPEQEAAASFLGIVYSNLWEAQVRAARKAIDALKEKAKTDLEAQKELEKLPPGTAEAMVKDFPENFKVEDLLRIQEVAGKKQPGGKDDEPDFKNAPLYDVDKNAIELQKDSGVRQDPYSLKLGTVAEKTAILTLPRDKEKNAVKPFIQEKFDDLVGKLLDEADELTKDYQTLNLSTNQNNNDPGEIGKNGGALNSTGAVAATGNKKPPTTDSGGVARTGRQGARAHGMVADDEGINRRGRDKALEGQEQVADQKGTIKMQKSDDMQKDTSTGVGGKKVESDDTHFSLADAGKWKDEMTKRLEKPQKKQYIVERQGDKLDPKVAALLRDLNSKQEQVIERLKSIKKELKNLYLPTEHLDDLVAALETNLDALKDRPEAELFRLQTQTLDKLRGTLRVFQNAGASFQPSLPRERLIRGRVLDEPGAQALPGYEDAVRQYYLKLAEQ